LPQLLEDLAQDREIIIVEGERKVDLLRSWNIPATCNPMGAEKWRDEYSAVFRGARVCILPDNDGPGRKHIDKVASSLVNAGVMVRVLDLPGLAPHEDIINWAAAGGTAEQLHELIKRAVPYQARFEPVIEDRQRGEPYDRQLPPKFPLVAWKDISFDLEEEWRVEGLLPRVGLACLYGGTGAVKTFIWLDLFERMSRGGLWAGRDVEQGPVVYIAAEGAGGIRKRIAGLKKDRAGKGLPADVPFYLLTVAPNLGTGEDDRVELIRQIFHFYPVPSKRFSL
jgi:hypothetical protein